MFSVKLFTKINGMYGLAYKILTTNFSNKLRFIHKGKTQTPIKEANNKKQKRRIQKEKKLRRPIDRMCEIYI